MSQHQAKEQMLGYLYQVRYALALLLEQEESDAQISIERFDDVAFSDDDVPIKLIQMKHHVKSAGNLSDASVDIWRTLNVWIDAVRTDSSILEETKFLIITTGKAPEGSAAYYLRDDDNRDTKEAHELLNVACATSSNATNKKYYSAFQEMKASQSKALIRNIYVIDKAPNALESEKVLRRSIRYSCQPKHENQIFERIEGWWFGKAVEALMSEAPLFFSQKQVRSRIVQISQEYADDNLPIDVPNFTEGLDEESLNPEDKLFLEQLRLVAAGNNRVQISSRDYYRAFCQRGNWVRNDLLYINELDEYEERLVDEWEHCFAAMKDKITLLGTDQDEEAKVRYGAELFSFIESKDIRIRPKCCDAFVMRGSYHMLANELKVGWHVDFYSRLKHLLL